MPASKGLLLAVLLATMSLVSGCEHKGCLAGEATCRVPPPCAGLATPACTLGEALSVQRLETNQAGPLGREALGRAGDIVLANDQVVAVIAGIGNQNYLDPNGGSLLDLSTRGLANDGLNQILQVVGILPDDSAYYTSLEIIDERPARVAVQVRGTLYHRPDVPIYTIYELRGCESGLRMRTEVVNKSPDPQLWALSDGFYWSGRSMLPFTPYPGSGFAHESFNLLTINEEYHRFPFVAASQHSDTASSYALVACNVDSLEGFNSAQVSTAGLSRTVVESRDYLIYERFLAVTPRADVASAAELALGVRRALFGEESVAIRGRVIGGAKSAALETRATILISAIDSANGSTKPTPWTQVIADADGTFSAHLPRGKSYVLAVESFGRKRLDSDIGVLQHDEDLGDLVLEPLSGHVTLTVRNALDASNLDAEIFVVPADAAVEAATVGAFHGQDPRCAPYLGAPHGPSPACNRVLVPHTGSVRVEVPVGRYHFYAYHGPFWSLARTTIDVTADSETPLSFMLASLPLLRPGRLSADLHVHGGASFDSSIPDRDRVLSFAAADMQVLIATDHDVVTDYQPTLDALDLSAKMSAVSGVETTGHIPFFTVPGDTLPLVIGHYNFWPLKFDGTLPRNGGPFDEFIEPGVLFDRAEALFTSAGLIQLNHPWAEPEFGRDLGYPRALGLSTLRDLPAMDDGTAAGMYVRVPDGGHANNSHHAQEVMNGTDNSSLLQYRAFWFYMLNQGMYRTGTANSDSHGLTDNTIGSPRNVVTTETRPGPTFDIASFNHAVREGRVLGTNGPIIEAEVQNAQGASVGYGASLIETKANSVIFFNVYAAPWIPVESVRFIVNGRLSYEIPRDKLLIPGDPFGRADTTRYPQGAYPLSSILPEDLEKSDADVWIVIEAGARLPVVADLGGGPNGEPDGIPDTSDNNGDGKVDANDIEPGKKIGPIKGTTIPVDPIDPNYHFSRIVTGGYPFAFTNPFFLDRNGNGVFDPPKTGGAK